MTSLFLAFWAKPLACLARMFFLLTKLRILNIPLVLLVWFYFVSWALRFCSFLFLPEEPLFCWLSPCLCAWAAALPCRSLTSKPQSLCWANPNSPCFPSDLCLHPPPNVHFWFFGAPPITFLCWLLFQPSFLEQLYPSLSLWPTSPASTRFHSAIFHLIVTLLWIWQFLCSTWLTEAAQRREHSRKELWFH